MRIVVIFCLIMMGLSLSAQESSGLVFGNHNGILATKVNPAFSLKSNNSWEIQLIGSHGFFETNYAFINNTSLIELLKNYEQVEIPTTDIPIDQYEYPLIFRNTKANYYFDVKSEVLGPGFLINRKDWSFGLHAKARVYGAARGVPQALSYQNLESLPVDSLFSIMPFQSNVASWMEYVGHFAKDLGGGNQAGVNIKFIKGYHAAKLNNKTSFGLTRNDLGRLEANVAGQVSVAISDSIQTIRSSGTGFGLDVGLTSNNIFPFSSTWGISLLDLGWINYSGKQYQVDFDAATQLDIANYEDLESSEEIIQQLENDLVSIDSTSGFRMLLPTALSIQFSKKVTDRLLFEGQAIQRLKFAANQLSRSNSVTASLIYDTRHLTFALPLRLYEYQQVDVGASLRIYFFTIGSDNLMSIFGNEQDFDGTDLYVNVKYYPFKRNDKNEDQIKCFY